MTAMKKTRTPPRTSFHVHEVDRQHVLEVIVWRPRSAENTYYLVEPIPSDFGVAYSLTKIGGDRACYRVCLEHGADHCECQGHSRYGRCRHVAGLRAMREEGCL